MNKKFLNAALILSITLISACASNNSFSPPKKPRTPLPNAAYYVQEGPYKDDCWYYGWGCAPPGTNPNISVRPGNPNPAQPVYIIRPSSYKIEAGHYPNRPTSSSRKVVKP
jgi:hypothetical protein